MSNDEINRKNILGFMSYVGNYKYAEYPEVETETDEEIKQAINKHLFERKENKDEN